tara:strand:- start:2308 stop:3588 length:1281 start_codon:yes stop_codon:yes gene_type:complete
MTLTIRKIHVLGINSYEFKDLPLKLQNLFNSIENIAIPDSYIEKIKSWEENNTNHKKNFFISKSDQNLIKWLKLQSKDVILISRGDPLWFGIGRLLLENFKQNELIFYPSNTCMQIAFSKIKLPWNNANFISIHGRDSSQLAKALKAKQNNLVIITDSNHNSVELIQNNILEHKLEDFYDFWLCEEMGLKNERIRKLKIKEKLPNNIFKLNIVILLKKNKFIYSDDIPLFGLKDSTFKTFEDRPNLLTKREVRIQILADLELPDKGNILDIGAGCGSIGLEAIKLRPNLKLFCIEKRVGSKNLIMENAKTLKVFPEKIIEEDINDLLNSKFFESLGKINRVIIGGCNKKTKLKVISKLSKLMTRGDVVIIPIIDIEALKELREILKINNFDIELNLIQNYKSLSIAEGIRLDPINPVFLLKGQKSI